MLRTYKGTVLFRIPLTDVWDGVIYDGSIKIYHHILLISFDMTITHAFPWRTGL